MRKLYGFTILIGISLYLIFLYLDPRRIFTFITERYYFVILGSGLLLFVLGVSGIYYIIKNKKYEESISLGPNLIKDKKFILITVLSLLGLFIHPLFLLICSVLFLFKLKNSTFDILLAGDVLKPFLLFLVIGLGVILPSSQISSATADQRIGNFNSVNLGSQGETINNFNSNTKNYDIGDWIISLSYNPELDNYVGKEVDVSGFIFSPQYLPENTFLVSRFVIRCCAADATPVGLNVEYEWDNEFKTDEWVRVIGKFEKRNINGKEDLIIILEKIERIDIPERPYIS